MIYLSDVCSGSGPHTYMRKTHKPFKDEKTWRQIKPYGRYTDEQVYSLFGRENEIKICGGAGTVILVDTSGFHKGQILMKGHSRNGTIRICRFFNTIWTSNTIRK